MVVMRRSERSERMRPGGFYLTRRQGALACDVAELDDLLGPARLRTGRLRPARALRREGDLVQLFCDLPGPASGGPIGRLDPYGILWASQTCTMFFHTM